MELSIQEKDQMANAIGLRCLHGNDSVSPWEQKIRLSNTKLYLLSQLEKINGLPQIMINQEIKSGKIKVVA